MKILLAKFPDKNSLYKNTWLFQHRKPIETTTAQTYSSDVSQTRQKKWKNQKYYPKICIIRKKHITLHPQKISTPAKSHCRGERRGRGFEQKRSLRLSARTRDFHSLKRSSILLGTTKIHHQCSDAPPEQIVRRKGGGGFLSKSA